MDKRLAGMGGGWFERRGFSTRIFPHFSLREAHRITQLPRVDRHRSGVLAALAAFFLWGILPVFWKLLNFLPPQSIVAQRTVWSLLLVLGILWWRGEGKELLAGLRSRRALGWHFLSGCLLACNWLLYVWATLNGRIIEAALGYYLNPFFNMLFGAIWFGDKNSRWQLAAIALALGGVALQVPAVGHFPWVALTLAVSFSLYAVVRKRAPLGSLVGLTAETSLLAPVALGWLVFSNPSPQAKSHFATRYLMSHAHAAPLAATTRRCSGSPNIDWPCAIMI